MAELIRANGTTEEVEPKNGTDFTLEELQGYVGGYIEMVRRDPAPGSEALVINEEGKLEGLARNEKATRWAHARRAIFPGDYIAGDALLIRNEEVK